MPTELELKERTAGRLHFSADMPGMQIAWDSTSLGTLKECPRKYYYSMIQSYRTKVESIHLVWGIMYHATLEAYDHAKAQGMNHDEAVRETIKKALTLTSVYDKIMNEETGEEQKLFKPWDSGDSLKNRMTLIRATIWYLEHFKDDPCETLILKNGKPAVELSFRMELGLPAPDGTNFMYCGHMDRLAIFNDDIWVLDRKTTKGQLNDKYFQGFTPDNQMSGYTMAAQVVFDTKARGVIIDGCQTAVGFNRFKRGFAMRTARQTEEWLEDFSFWMKQAELFAEARYWPMNDKSCHKYNGCQFLEICSKDPAVRDKFLASGFDQKDWNPLEAR